ncbi:hypothetical protein Poli38472_012874 [Pythium oligandrum]|uniref:phosphatidylinositol-3,5-bisphosphate 3-phosphatase n=1 Tax=Pythium oligandrum TaxID=41045 RepID=A0A8K1CIV7_PYTOL|nr:hypothetical protein Poli38472_012874 [Pythium oligandrum]|eukprot:TMW64252.1 hypothetical protein Poli38472_012874 [Pythium oligandrum]
MGAALSERDAACAREREGTAPKDPLALTQWLLERCAMERSTTTTNGHANGSAVAGRMSGSIVSNGRDVDEEEGEDVDEEEEVVVTVAEDQVEAEAAEEEEEETVDKEEEEEAVAWKNTPLESEMDTVASALEIVKDVSLKLQLTLSVLGRDRHDSTEQPKRGTTRSSTSPGVPTPNARPVASPSCAGCRRYFSAFQRARNCQSCGHLYCAKCISKQQMLPSSFGCGDQVARVCDTCSLWFQRALDQHFDILQIVQRTNLVKQQSVDSSYGTVARSESIDLPIDPKEWGPSSPQSVSGALLIDDSSEKPEPSIRRHRHSIAAVERPRRASKPWFGGNLRAMHVGDRQPTRKSTLENNPVIPNDAARPNGLTKSEESVPDDLRNLDTGVAESSEGEEGNGEAGERRSGSAGDSEQTAVENEVIGVKIKSARVQRRKGRRSTSFDYTNLHSSLSPRSPSSSSLVASDAGDTASGRSSAHERLSFNGKKCFDDSDIVDDQRQAQMDEAAPRSDRGVNGAVVRFAVYDVGSKDSQSLKRALVRFGKKNIVLDRYTLEVDYHQGIVRVKSVFMHRFWWFRCDAVEDVSFQGTDGVAKVILSRQSGHGSHTVEWEFGSDAERHEFKEIVDELKSSSVKPIRPKQHPDPEVLSSKLSHHLGSEFSDISNVVDGVTLSAEEPCRPSTPDALLQGEKKVSGPDVPVTLLIGPSGDFVEASALWGRVRGTLLVTNYRVLFKRLDKRSVCWGISYVPLFSVISASVTHANGRKPRSALSLQFPGLPILVLVCKDARVMRLEIEGQSAAAYEKAQMLGSLISQMADAAQRWREYEVDLTSFPKEGENTIIGSVDRPLYDQNNDGSGGPLLSPRSIATSASPVIRPNALSSPEQTLSPLERSDAFAYYYSVGTIESEYNGWKIYTDEREFKRQIAADPAAQPFLKFYQNSRGTMCKSYPTKLLVPASMNSTTLAKVAEFRAKNRLPVITYYHRKNRCVLVRSGQPLLGNLLSGSSSLSDQLLINTYRRLPEIITTQSNSAPSSRPIYIFDARKLKASTGNRLIGKGGVETPQDYVGAVVYHLNIANMYRMQSSFQALLKLVLPGGVDDHEKAWLSSLEATQWLNHVRLVLEGAVKIARVLELEGSSVLVHCSDGWDRTSQLTALAQLMIDPYYRTIRGFAVLVEKDWCAFGHKFSERLGSDRNKDPNRAKSSPIMFQFLDAVWQILRQNASAFEFNEQFLLHIANSLTSGLYGTFMYDSRLQRDVNRLDESTISVWTPVLLSQKKYLNPSYVPVDRAIWPWTSPQMMRLWEGYFFQYHPKYHDCRWIPSLVHLGGRPEAKKKSNSVKGRSASESNESTQQKNELHDDSTIEIMSRDRFGSVDITSSQSRSETDEYRSQASSQSSFRSQRSQKKPPPMHKIFLFKS